MANTRTVGAAGDHTTIASALAWFQTAAANHQFGAGGDGIGTIELIDAVDFDEEITVDDLNYNSGAPTSSSYLVITASSGVRHAGLYNTGKAQLSSSSSAQSAIIMISESYTVLEYLQISQESSTGSDECVRVNTGVVDYLISRCILRWAGSGANSGDCLYTGNWACNGSVDNTIAYGAQRAGFHFQNYDGSATQTHNIDHCTVFDSGSDGGATEDGGISSRSDTSCTNNLNIYNTASIDSGVGDTEDFEENDSGTHNWTGTHNASSDASLTARSIATSAQESLTSSDTTQSSGSFYVVVSKTTPDYQLLDDAAGNLAAANGTDRIGSEPDSRQDFSTDIAGNTRPTTSVDIGASQVSVVAGGSVNPQNYYHQLMQ